MAHTLPAIANTQEPDSDFALIARLVRDYVWKYRRLVIIAALCMIVGAAATGITAWLLDPAVKLIFIDRRGTGRGSRAGIRRGDGRRIPRGEPGIKVARPGVVECGRMGGGDVGQRR